MPSWASRWASSKPAGPAPMMATSVRMLVGDDRRSGERAEEDPDLLRRLAQRVPDVLHEAAAVLGWV